MKESVHRHKPKDISCVTAFGRFTVFGHMKLVITNYSLINLNIHLLDMNLLCSCWNSGHPLTCFFIKKYRKILKLVSKDTFKNYLVSIKLHIVWIEIEKGKAGEERGR